MAENKIKYDKYSLTFSVLYLGLLLAFMLVHGLLGVVRSHIFWLVVNIVFTMIAITFIVLTSGLLFRRCMINRHNDLISFVLCIIAFIISIICFIWWLSGAINNLIGIVREM